MQKHANSVENYDWSTFQKEVFRSVEFTDQNIVIRAVAGAAKTTTILEAAKRISPVKKVLFTAFNKSIAKNLQSKLPSYIDCSTLHSLGFKSLQILLKGRGQVVASKTFLLIRDISKKWKIELKNKEAYRFFISKAIDLLRMNQYGEDQIENVLDYYSLYQEEKTKDHIIETLSLLKEYNQNLKKNIISSKGFMVDFTDMICLPIELDLGLLTKKYDIVFIDELQDLNKAQQKLIDLHLKPRSRTIAVGDPNQSIYMWSGADQNSFTTYQNRKNTITLPLSICYRCCKQVVSATQTIVPEIQPWENQEEGLVINSEPIKVIVEGDWVLCRNNKPLIVLYCELLKLKRKVKIKDTDLLKSLVLIFDKIKHLSHSESIIKLNDILSETKQRLIDQGIFKVNKHPKIKALVEQINIILTLIEFYEGDVKETYSHLSEIFTDKESDQVVNLMTVHKSKGLENDNVYIIRPDLLRRDYDKAVTDWEKQQQDNLKYVAYTRAKKKLSIIPLKEFDDMKSVPSPIGNFLEV